MKEKDLIEMIVSGDEIDGAEIIILELLTIIYELAEEPSNTGILLTSNSKIAREIVLGILDRGQDG